MSDELDELQAKLEQCERLISATMDEMTIKAIRSLVREIEEKMVAETAGLNYPRC